MRSALYVDGFNMYHALNDYALPYLKWLSLFKLGQIIIPSETEELVKAVFCTAYYPGSSEKRWRHDQYLNALRATGVTCALGHYVTDPIECRADCGKIWSKRTEKEGDINLALHLFNDAWMDVYDHAYLLTADSDQAATAKLFRSQFPDKKLTTVAPPGRNFSVHITNHANAKLQLNLDHIERAIFPAVVINPTGSSGRRPREYDPPPGWVHPDDRPKKGDPQTKGVEPTAKA